MKLFCPICESEKDVDLLGAYKNRNELFDKKQLFQCSYCKLIFVHPMPSEKDLDFYYKNNWLKDETIISSSKDSILTYQIQADERTKYLSRYIDLAQNAKILDVGSGFGYLYDSLKKFGLKNISFYATDSNPENLHRLKNKGIRSFPDIREIKEHDFDLVTICFVLEHINEPLKFMRLVVEYVKEGGYIFIDIPQRDDLFKPILEPHVTVFTSESLMNLVSKLGLGIVHITGYGQKISTIRAELNDKKSTATVAKTAMNNMLNEIKNLTLRSNKFDKKIKDLYMYYRFDEEGTERRWIRAILQKPMRNVFIRT